ncbi:ABC transporter permease [Aquabacterium sp. J223]|uniref:ABC transporter permease n=1 Tax=Aquabacterium sp. J223 TaxID=2898431 RepID=UPI0021AE3015|nr:ABC transporter permease [Aquabacterium sp. J223]UUX96971.1 ABC transporter permease [Aquabacterium sp. J223]
MGVPLAILGGAIRVGTPLLWVSLGETVTEKAGRINLGLEGTLLMGAMTAFAVSLGTGQPWLGVLAAALVGTVLGLLHGLLCGLPRVNDIALGIALMLAGSGLAFWLGKPLIQPSAPPLPAVPIGTALTDQPALRAALDINPLFVLGLVGALAVHLVLQRSRIGLKLRVVGDSDPAARAFGLAVGRYRMGATAFGGACAGVGGASLSLFYPGAWSEALSSGQGVMAVALVIFARWDPRRCIWAALLFGGASAISPALQALGYSQGYYLLAALPYVVTLAILIGIGRPSAEAGAPGELSLNR